MNEEKQKLAKNPYCFVQPNQQRFVGTGWLFVTSSDRTTLSTQNTVQMAGAVAAHLVVHQAGTRAFLFVCLPFR
jgi:hypothetical protein